MADVVRKLASVVVDSTLGERQVRVIANSGQSDRVKDVLFAKGCKLDHYRANNIVLAQHDPDHPVGNFDPEINGDRVEGVITFAPKGISEKADTYCGLYKSGVLKTVSVGFRPLDYEPNKNGGYNYLSWDLLELSCVSVPCDPGAVVIARALEGGEEPRWKCGASLTLPVRGDAEWRGWTEARVAIFDHADFDGAAPDLAFARKGFLLYRSDAPRSRLSYPIPFADMVEGRLTVTRGSLRSARDALTDNPDLPPDLLAKALGVLDHYEAKMQPKAITAATAPNIKGLYDVAYLAQLLVSLGYIHDDALREAAVEGDDSPLPVMLANALKVLADAFLAMSREEVAELLAGHDVEIEDDEPLVAAAPTPAAKAWRSALVKAGRALSEENAAHVKAIAKCMKAMVACHTKALDSHGQTHDDLVAFRSHLDAAAEHVKALAQKAKPKPKPDDEDEGDEGGEGDAGDDGSDVELSAAAARRKRLIAIAAKAV